MPARPDVQRSLLPGYGPAIAVPALWGDRRGRSTAALPRSAPV